MSITAFPRATPSLRLDASALEPAAGVILRGGSVNSERASSPGLILAPRKRPFLLLPLPQALSAQPLHVARSRTVIALEVRGGGNMPNENSGQRRSNAGVCSSASSFPCVLKSHEVFNSDD